MDDLEFVDEILDDDNVAIERDSLDYLDDILELNDEELEPCDDCEVLDSDFIDSHCIPVNTSTIQNFPIVEDDFDAITDYELFSKGFEFLDEVKADKSELSEYVKKDEIPPLDSFVTKDTKDLEYYTLSSDLSDVALTGSYDDLSDKPTIPDVSNFITKDVNNLTYYTLTSNLSSVATTGDYDDLINKPTIPVVPTNISAFNNDSGYITKDVNDLTNYTLTSSLSSVATSGNYNDLTNKPTIPDVSNFITKDVDDLTNYYDKTTIQNRESSIVNLIPTKTSDLQNDSDFITLSDVPTNLSSYVNDEGFITNTVSNLTNYTLTTDLNANFDKVLKKNDASLLADATIVNITPLAGSNYSSYSNSFYYKIGTRVHIHLGLKGLTANTLQQVFDIPVGYRPRGHMVSVGQGGGSDVVGQGIIQADTHTLEVRSPSAYISVDFEYDAFN